MWLQNSWWTTARVVFQTKTYKLLSTCTEYTVNKMLGRLLFIPNFLCKACSFSTLFFSASLGYWHYKLIKKYPLCCRVSLTTAEYFLIYFSRWINARSCCTIVVQNQHPKSKIQSHRCRYVARKHEHLLCSKHILFFHPNTALFPSEPFCIDMPILPLCRIDYSIFFFAIKSIPRYNTPESWN